MSDGEQLGDECGPHCVNKDKVTRHCPCCHARQCEASRYDRTKVART